LLPIPSAKGDITNHNNNKNIIRGIRRIRSDHDGVTSHLAGQASEDETVESISSCSRRKFWNTVTATGFAMIATTTATTLAAPPANAFDRTDPKFAYSIQIPESCKEGSKPVKTHQDEINFISGDIRGYQYGITVDPVRINSLKEVGDWKILGK